MYDPLRAKAKVALMTAAACIAGLGIAAGAGWTGLATTAPELSTAPQVTADAVRPALDLSESFVNVAEAVTPAVVRIEARVPVRASGSALPRGALERFFGPGAGEGDPQIRVGGGSGFVVSPDGYILTNDHVVNGADQILVHLTDGRYFEARLVGTDPFTDVAVVKIDVPERLPTLSFGDSEEVRVGEWVLAVGNPGFGSLNRLEYTVTAGIVSARGRGLQLINQELRNNPSTADLAPYAIEDFIQTDAVINPGNSGGPMVDLQGRAVGINSAIASETGFYQGYGFAIPINLARRVMDDLIEYGHVKRPMLGVNIGPVFLEDAEAYGLPTVSGVLVNDVEPDTPAEKAGLRSEDVIVAIDGEPVAYPGQLQGRVAQHHPGDRITVTLYREGHPQDVTVRLGEAPINEVTTEAPPVELVAEERLGISVEPITPEIEAQASFSEPGGVIISNVQRGSPAARRNFSRGLKILSINGDDIETTDDVRESLARVEPGDIVTFRLQAFNGTSLVYNVRMPG